MKPLKKFHVYFLLFLFVLAFNFCSSEADKKPVNKTTEGNPFFTEFKTPFGVPPFDIIKEDHYKPAFKKGIEQQQKEIEAIVSNTEEPTFENTIEALEKSGKLLTKVENVFDNMKSANTNETLQKIAKDISPMLSKHQDDIRLNAKLFKRVKTVYEKRKELKLSAEQKTLLEKIYKNFVRGGANLNPEKQSQLREINKELSLLSLKFGENILKENNKFKLLIDKKEDLAGLPQSVIQGAAEAAKESGHEGKWIFTLHKPSMSPFLMYSEKRNLREKIYNAYINRGDNNDELDNKNIVSKMAKLRVKRANLLGYATHADYILEKNMAKKPENVYKLLNQLWNAALPIAKREAKELQKIIDKEGGKFKLKSWDWWYYAEKLKKAKYELDDSVLRPYFKLENVIDGVFTVANKLFGIKLVERTDIPKYHEDVRVFEVQESDGSHVGVLYVDYFPRASKRGGAWMNSFRKQYEKDGKRILPVICNVGNFSKPTGDTPALLNFEEVSTLFHEFGHGLHGLLSNCKYELLSGTSVPRDFVELPSQIMENWAGDPDVIKMYAKHYKTGEVIPQTLIEKIKKSGNFNQGFRSAEYLAACFLDMDWHTVKEAKDIDVDKFETESLNKIGLIPEIIVRYRSTYFGHIFRGGYSSGYYSYIWSEVLDADAFEAFKETSLFDSKTALSLRKNILEKGGSEDPMILYKRFRGAEPKIEPLLKRKGFVQN